jgi:hypothetical protein
LVVATHARGIFILDNLNAVQEMTPAVTQSTSHLFTVEPAEMRRLAGTKAHAGDMIFRGENPPAGAIIDYYLGDAARNDSIAIVVRDALGREVSTVRPTRRAGVNRVVWNLRLNSLPGAPAAESDDDDAPRGAPPGRYVAPGRYTIRLTVGSARREQTVLVREDSRLQITALQRTQWHTATDSIASVYRQVVALGADAATGNDAELRRTIRELQDRVGTLYGNVQRGNGPPTADQRKQMAYFPTVLRDLRARMPR